MKNVLQNFNFFNSDSHDAHPNVAISACLNGESVRYDGASKPLINSLTLLANELTLISICPEVGAGMSVPRPPIQLEKSNGHIEVIGRSDKSINQTTALDHYRQQSFLEFGKELCGYIFKSRSPSCGLGSTPIFNQDNQQIDIGSGMQASYFKQHMPWLPCVEESDLESENECLKFILQCRLLSDLKQACSQFEFNALHEHYAFIRPKFSNELQRELQEYLQKQDEGNYWRVFLLGTKSFFKNAILT